MTPQSPKPARRGPWLVRIASGAVLVTMLGLIALLVWARQVAPASSTAWRALDSDELVRVTRDDWIVLEPRDEEPTVGVIFYPGGKAEPIAYGPILRTLAASGYLVVITPMPLNLAILDTDRALDVMPRFPGIRRWVIAGHSFGGSIACEFAATHVTEVDGVVLWASYPGHTADLSGAPLPVLSVSGTVDTLTTSAKIEAARSLLPETTRYVALDGVDHWGFGDFALDSAQATLPRAEQQALILQATLEFLDSLRAQQPSGA